MAILIESKNYKPNTMCGIACRITTVCAKLPNIPLSDKDFCYCHYECDYMECVFGGDPNMCNNDKSSFLFRKITSSDTVTIEIQKRGVTVHTVIDNSYGIYIVGFLEQPLYVGFIADWDKILTAFGHGEYKIVTTVSILSNVSVFNSCIYYLQQYTAEDVNGTVRVEWWQDGNIESSEFDFTGLEWYQSIRVKSSFVPIEPTVIHDRHLSSARRSTQIQSQVISNYEWLTHLIPEAKADKLVCDLMLANEVWITNGNLFENNYKQLKVKPENVDELNTFGRNRRTQLKISFSDRFENKLKRNDSKSAGVSFKVPESAIEFQMLIPIGGFSGLISGAVSSFNLIITDKTGASLIIGDLITFTISVNGSVQEILNGVYGSDLSTFTSTKGSNGFNVFGSGNVSNGSLITFNNEEWGYNNGFNEITTPPTYINLAIVVNDISDSTFSLSSGINIPTVQFTPIPAPIARIPNQTFVGGSSGRIDLTLNIREDDDVTPLVAGDPVVIEIFASEGGLRLETLTGVYGQDISTFASTNFWAPIIDSYTLHSIGLVVDGGTIEYSKKDHASVNGSITYGAFDSSISPQWTIVATDLTTGLTSINSDNFINVQKIMLPVVRTLKLDEAVNAQYMLSSTTGTTTSVGFSSVSLGLISAGSHIIDNAQTLANVCTVASNVANPHTCTTSGLYIIDSTDITWNDGFYNGMSTKAARFTRLGGTPIPSTRIRTGINRNVTNSFTIDIEYESAFETYSGGPTGAKTIDQLQIWVDTTLSATPTGTNVLNATSFLGSTQAGGVLNTISFDFSTLGVDYGDTVRLHFQANLTNPVTFVAVVIKGYTDVRFVTY